jgi:transposase-like protein
VLAHFEGEVIADETFFGGVEGNKPLKVRREVKRIEPGKRSVGPRRAKTAVLSLIDADTGEVRSKVVPDVTGATLAKVIADTVNLSRTELVTDENSAYDRLRPELVAHHTVNHKDDEYVRYDNGRTITTNRAEGYFSQLKRSIDGTHHHVSREHLQRYLDEFDFRYSTRKLNDGARLQRMVDQVDGRRLTYKRITEA